MRSSRYYLLLLLIICFCQGSLAQRSYLFSHLGRRDGLASNIVHRVQQDANGYIWVLANNYLQRYDGYRFQTFLAGPSSFPEGIIRGFEMDKHNRMWLHINDTILGYLNPDNFKWTPVKVNLPKGWTTRGSGLFITNHATVMLVFPEVGYLTYNDATRVADEKNNPFTLPQGWKVLNTWQDKKNNYWFGTSKGLVKYNPANKKISYAGNNSENDSSIHAFANIKMASYFFIDRNNRRWLGSWPEETGISLKSLEPNGTIKEWNPEISKALKGTYYTNYGVTETSTTQWIAGGNLFAWYDSTYNKFQLIADNQPGEYSIRYDIINHLYEDREKNIWVSTSKGLYRFNPGSQVLQVRKNYLPGKDSAIISEVTDILETASGEVLMSTWGSGIFSYDKNLQPIPSKIFPNNTGMKEGMVWTMAEMNNGDLWWGVQGGWICRYDIKEKRIIRMQPEMVQKRTVRQIKKDKTENLWIGTHGGHIIRYNPLKNEWLLVHKAKAVISKILISSKNEIWVATDIDGVYRFSADGKMLLHYTNGLPTGKRMIVSGASDICEYNDSTIVILGTGFNIVNTRTNDIRFLHKGDNPVNGLVDDKGLIWTTSALGLMAQSLKSEGVHFTFDERDGLDNFTFSTGAATILKNGTHIFGNNQGFLSYHPDQVMLGFTQYDFDTVKLAEFVVNEKKLSVDSVLHLQLVKLGPGSVSIKARFTTNTFQSLYGIFYQIEGLDTAWKQAPNSGEVSLNYLPPGKYILRAAVMNGNNEPQEIRSIVIEVVAPFYKTAWFYMILLVLFLAGLYWFDRQRMKRNDELLKVRRGIASNLHEDISNTLEKINILSEMAVIKNENEPEKSKEFLAQIKQVSSNMISAMQDMLWSISPENDKTEKLLNRLVRYVQVLNNRHNMQIEIATDDNLKRSKFDMQFRYEILLLFKHSIKSLIHAGAEDIRIYLGAEKNYLLYNIEFSHKNADRRQLNNFFNSKELADKVQAINGTITSNIGTRTAEIECKIVV
jgi:ligand-binding sensor domain-containing protein